MTDLHRDLPDRLPPAGDVDITPRESFYQRRPVAGFMDDLRDRRRPRSWLPVVGLISAGALAAAVLLVVAPWNRDPVEPPSSAPSAEEAAFGVAGTHQSKSTQQAGPDLAAAPVDLTVVVLRAGRPEPVAEGAALTPDTLVRFLYDSPDHDYLMLVSLTDQGDLSVLYPMTEGPSIPVIRGRGIPLQGAVQLDDHLGPERFFALFSDAPLAFEQVEDAAARARGVATGETWLRDLGRLPLPCAQATLLIEKEGPREANDG